MVDRWDRWQRRHRWLGFPVAVGYKFFEDSGMQLVAALVYYSLIAAFPVLIVLTAAVHGVLLAVPSAQALLAQSLLVNLPFVGDRITGVRVGPPGGAGGVLLAVLGGLYGGLGVSITFQHAMNTIWSVPRNNRPNPVIARLRGLVLLVLMVGSVLVASLIAGAAGPVSNGIAGVLGLVAVFASTLLIVLLGLRVGTGVVISWRQVLPGAVVISVVWPALQVITFTAVGRVAGEAMTGRRVAFMILGLTAMLHIAGLTVLLAAEANAVRVLRLYPRALMTAFSDNVELTEADKTTYTLHARAQRFKGQQRIVVSFGSPPPPGHRRFARRRVAPGTHSADPDSAADTLVEHQD